MSPRLLGTAGEKGLQAVIRLFPLRGVQIEQLLGRDENFRVMCDDLAAAGQALAAAGQLPEDLRTARRLEYEELINELAAEIEATLDRANIFPISRTPKY